MPRQGPVLLHVGAQLPLPEDVLAPYYDALLSRPELDLSVPSGYAGGTAALDVLRTWADHRPVLVARCEELAARRG